MKSKIYTPGKRFTLVLVLSFVMNESAVLVFYFVYRYVFGAAIRDWLLLTVFVLLGVIIGYFTLHFGKKIRGTIRYEVTPEALIVSSGRSERRIPWSSFTAADTKEINFFDTYPVYFEVDGKRFEISQYVDGVVNLGYDILEHMPEGAKISDGIRQMTQALRK